MKFVKAEEETPAQKKEEVIEAETAITTSTPLIDLTQSSSNGSNASEQVKTTEKTPAIRLNRRLADVSDNNNIEGSKPKRKITPVIKYGGIHYSNKLT